MTDQPYMCKTIECALHICQVNIYTISLIRIYPTQCFRTHTPYITFCVISLLKWLAQAVIMNKSQSEPIVL